MTSKFWLLQLVEIENGAFEWQDFIPSCKCKLKMTPAPIGSDQPQCPVCQGRKGQGNCFQFDCPEIGSLMYGCGEIDAASRPVYCGSHPYFSGYHASEGFHGSGRACPLFEVEEELDEDGDCSLTISMTVEKGLQAQMFLGLWCQHSYRAFVAEDQQSIIRVSKVGPKAGADRVSSAITIGFHRKHNEQGVCVQTAYMLVQRFGNETYVLRASDELENRWQETAEVPTGEDCRHFQKQLIKVNDNMVAGLSHDGLWLMTIPELDRGDAMSARNLARQLCWKKVLQLPSTKEDDDNEDDSPQRLIAAGPGENRVVIFAHDEFKQDALRPRLLVEISPKGEGHNLSVTHLTSVVYVPTAAQSSGEKAQAPSVLPSVVRIPGRRSGYLFFDTLGHVYQLRDEAIIPAQCLWQPPDFKQAEMMRRVVTFKFQDSAPDGSMQRVIPIGMLSRYEYFSKLVEAWHEGNVAEVVVTDVKAEIFDKLLTYVTSGTIEVDLELVDLTQLLTAANKYLMQDLIACALLRILAILDDSERMKLQDKAAMVDLFALSDNAQSSLPALRNQIIESVLSHRSHLLTDEVFLKDLAAKSASSLAQLLKPLQHCEYYDFGKLRNKRRRTEKIVSKCRVLPTSALMSWSLSQKEPVSA
eukprot:TRINITY_DN90866_c0_g1_i1.p1 TRINITY_DN90866_c0_g1~~TRINITY_DN90866_c0_g1_i1.p1  ORF type:complete len:713 (-),score=124.79 TRINITY_DN90866_c0_g1_i1:256-2178(-)